MKLLFLGDIFGKAGRRIVAAQLPALRAQHGIDCVIANAENLTNGKGASVAHLQQMQAAGVDVFTGGNHSFAHTSCFAQPELRALRPANFGEGAPGSGALQYEVAGKQLLVLNLEGRVFMKNAPLSCPFARLDEFLTEHADTDAVVLDIHAETTSEKAALWHYCRARVGVVVGTHTHVPTADGRIVAGSFFQTDIGFCGVHDSVIGVPPAVAIDNFTDPVGRWKFRADDGAAQLCGVIVTLAADGRATNFQQIINYE